MRNKCLVISIVIFALILTGIAYAQSSWGSYLGYPIARIMIDGQVKAPSNPAIIIQGRTYVPLRYISEALGAGIDWDQATGTVKITKTPKYIQCQITRVVDGDTIETTINGVTEKIRLIGVDTPETKHPTVGIEPYGQEASDYTTSQLNGKTIYLEKDVQERDTYGRILAYVWLSEPSVVSDSEIRAKMFNAQLLLDGYAQLATYPPNVKYVDYFTKYQTEAREANKGLWDLNSNPTTTTTIANTTTTLPSSGGTTVYITASGAKYHVDGCSYLSSSKIPISLSEAKAKGYGPCSKCNPPQ